MNSIIQELKTGFRLPRCNSFRTSTFLFLPIVLILLWADSTLATTTMKHWRQESPENNNEATLPLGGSSCHR